MGFEVWSDKGNKADGKKRDYDYQETHKKKLPNPSTNGVNLQARVEWHP